VGAAFGKFTLVGLNLWPSGRVQETAPAAAPGSATGVFSRPAVFRNAGLQQKQSHDCVPVEASKPVGTANRAALKETLNRTHCCFGLRKHRVPSQFGVRFTKGGIAGSAAPALNAALTKVPKAFAVGVLASYAGHGSLCFIARQAVKFQWVGIAASPACRLAVFVGTRQRQGVILVAPEGFQPSISLFQKEATTCEWAEPHNEGIYGSRLRMPPA